MSVLAAIDWSSILTGAVVGAVVVLLVAIGFATKLWAMVFIFPLLGHATWRAYRELVEQ